MSDADTAAAAPAAPRLRPVMLFVALLVLGWVCYRSALDYPFIQDDYHHMWESQWRGWSSLPHLLTVQLPFYRPVSNAWYFAIGHALWGLNPVPYHIVNLLAYVGSAWCVGLLGAGIFRSPPAGYAAACIFLTTCGHLLPIYWICVMTTGALVFWCVAAWVCDRRAWATGRRGWRVCAALAFTACVFSNITGFTLAAILTLSAKLLPPRPSWQTLARAHWPFYAAGALWLVLQFLVLGWPSLQNYAVGGAAGGLATKGVLLSHFLLYSLSPVYLLVLGTDAGGWARFGMLSVCVIALLALGAWRYRVHVRRDADAESIRTGLLVALFIVGWGLVPYLSLQSHFAPYHIGIASIGVSLALGWLFGRALPRGASVLVLAAWLCASLFAIRAYEQREHTTQGIGWKAELARNIVADTGGILAMHPDVQRLVILNYNEHLFWFFEHGNMPDLYYGRPDLEVVDGGDGRSVRPAPHQVVVRYRDRHLELVSD